MADFMKAARIGERNEGGWCDVAGDRGGETYRGIARNSHPEWPGWPLIDAWKTINGTPHWNKVFTDDDIPGLEALVIAFFKAEFWDTMKGDDINSDLFAEYFYDWYLTSQHKAVEKLQEVLEISPTTGTFGPITLAKVNVAGDDLLTKIHSRRVQYYQDHVVAVPEDKKFLAGWLERSQSLYEQLIAA
jgi:lysozyme family protein